MAAGLFSRSNNFFHWSIRFTKADIIRNCIVEKVNILKNKTVVFHKIVHVVIADILSTKSYSSFIYIPEAGKQMAEGCLTAAAWSDDCSCCICRDFKRDVVDDFALVVGKVDVFTFDFAGRGFRGGTPRRRGSGRP